MWNIFIITMMLAATGIYSSSAERSYEVAKQAAGRATAENMALYRNAVVAYFTANDFKNTNAPVSKLALPSWFTLNAGTTGATWSNYRDASGVIYIFPMASPVTLPSASKPTNIVNEVIEVSQNSSLVAVYRASDATLYYPIDGKRIAAASLITQGVADGAPVWVATRG
jgi:hypothetical protein